MAGGSKIWVVEENVAILTRMWSDGKPVSEIVTAIGGDVSRGAIIGKAARLKLGTHPNAAIHGNDKPKAKGPKLKSVRARPSRFAWNTSPKNLTIVHKPAPVVKPAVKPIDAPEVLPKADAPLPDSRMITLMDLTLTTCRWPYGQPSSSSFRYCGADCTISQSYCPAHRRMSYSRGTQSEQGALKVLERASA